MTTDDDKKLPTLLGGLDLDFPMSAPDLIGESKPIIRLDHGSGEHSQNEGTWSFRGQSFDELRCVLLNMHEVRWLYEADYKDVPDAPLVCASWDGVHAFGHGCRDIGTPRQERQCVELDAQGRRTGKKLCPSAGGSMQEWVCRPKVGVFALVYVDSSKDWFPGFLELGGNSFKPTIQAWKDVVARWQASEGKEPTYYWEYRARVFRPNPSKAGYAPMWGKPRALDAETRKVVLAWVKERAAEMWRNHLTETRDRALVIGTPAGDS